MSQWFVNFGSKSNKKSKIFRKNFKEKLSGYCRQQNKTKTSFGVIPGHLEVGLMSQMGQYE